MNALDKISLAAGQGEGVTLTPQQTKALHTILTLRPSDDREHQVRWQAWLDMKETIRES